MHQPSRPHLPRPCVSAACTDSSGEPRAHGEVWKASRDGCCMYRCDNDTVVPVEYNCSSVAVPVCRRAGEVIISLAAESGCCPQKVCGGSNRKRSQKLVTLKVNRRCDGGTFVQCVTRACASSRPLRANMERDGFRTTDRTPAVRTTCAVRFRSAQLS